MTMRSSAPAGTRVRAVLTPAFVAYPHELHFTPVLEGVTLSAHDAGAGHSALLHIRLLGSHQDLTINTNWWDVTLTEKETR